MKLGIIGLGRMGNAIAQRVVQAGHEVVGFDYSKDAGKAAQELGANIVDTVGAVAQHARIIWLMVPQGDPVDAVIQELLPHCKAGDIIIDGGNSKFTDSIRRAKELEKRTIFFLDCGTSGGLRGRELGFALMVGGDKAAYTKIHELLVAIGAPGGVGHVGPSGAGHYVKMVHNGIEYGLMQAYGEGMQLLKEGSFKESVLDLEEVTRIWTNGSVIRSWLLELGHDIVARDQELVHVSGEIQESGMGQWTVDDAERNNVPVPVIKESLAVRAQSRTTGGNYATKFVAMLRHAFGGHAVKEIKKN